MHNIWLSKHPDSTTPEQRLADQSNVIMRRNLLTSEIEEIQRGLSTQACHTESNTPEQPTSTQPDLTPIEEIPQQHSLNPRQMALKSRLIAQLQQGHRLHLPALKNTHRNKDLTQIIADINNVLRTVDTATIEETNQLLYNTVVVTEELGYKIQSNRTPTQDTPPKRWKVRLHRKIDKWRVDVSCLEHLENGTLRNKRTIATLTTSTIWKERQ